MLDKFCAGLKHKVIFEVLQAGPVNIDDAAIIAPNVNSAWLGAGIFFREFPIC